MNTLNYNKYSSSVHISSIVVYIRLYKLYFLSFIHDYEMMMENT